MAESLDCSDSNVKMKAIKNYAYDLFSKESTGHDFYHMKRVARLAKLIAKHEKANIFVCEGGAWLHDVGDLKLFQDPDTTKNNMFKFLQSIKIDQNTINQISIAIQDISYRDGKIPQTLEGKIIQDADRLDAIGAIGIARTFAYGGASGQLIYDHKSPDNTSIQHFYDKLLLLKDTINTGYAMKIAEERHLFMKKFLDEFYAEW